MIDVYIYLRDSTNLIVQSNLLACCYSNMRCLIFISPAVIISLENDVAE